MYCADHVGLYCGLIVAFSEVVSWRRLLRFAAKLPPPHGTSCARPPLNSIVELLIVAPVAPPEIVLVDAFFAFCELKRDVSVGL